MQEGRPGGCRIDVPNIDGADRQSRKEQADGRLCAGIDCSNMNDEVSRVEKRALGQDR